MFWASLDFMANAGSAQRPKDRIREVFVERTAKFEGALRKTKDYRFR